MRRVTALVLVILGTMVCLSVQANNSQFDHFTTGFELRGAHAQASCGSCHANGIFEGTPTACTACHSDAGTVAASAKPSHHIITTNQCSACHQSQAWIPVLRVDHFDVLGTCASCHNGFNAQGQHAGHIPTSADCGTCHNTRIFR